MPNVINATSTGNGGLITQGDDSGILNIQTNETTAITVDASQIVSYTNNLGTVAGYPAYQCRAWVNFNGTGTVAIRGSGNVSSITDIATGTYTVNFTTALPDANYSGLITSGFASGVREDILGFAYTDAPYAPTTGGYTVKFVRADTNVNVDTNFAMVAIFR